MPIEVHLVTPERKVWAGPAESLIARGVDGEVGILAGHAPLLIQLTVGPLRILQEGGEEISAVVDGGFLHVTSGGEGTRVDVMATHAELADQIDVDAARERLADLEGRLSGPGAGESDEELEAVRGELAKARARIGLAG